MRGTFYNFDKTEVVMLDLLTAYMYSITVKLRKIFDIYNVILTI